MTNKIEKIEMDIDVYDCMMILAEEYGGVSSSEDFSIDGAPCCVFGMARAASGKNFDDDPDSDDGIGIVAYLYELGLTRINSDTIIKSLGGLCDRIPLQDVFDKLGIVRGKPLEYEQIMHGLAR